MPAKRILVADDQKDILETLQLTLKNEGWLSDCVSSPDAVLKSLENQDYDLLLMDLNYKRDTTSGQEGLELLAKLKELDSVPPIVVMTAWGTIEVAVEALRLGARDFVEKPWDNIRLLSILRAQLDLQSSKQEMAKLTAGNAIRDAEGQDAFIAESQVMQDLVATLTNVAVSDASVLIIGENGSGKNQIASMLHQRSDRADKVFLTMDVGAITESLFESELFGHVRGAFTDAREAKLGRLELADQGTLFFDEIANINLAQQSRLLRVIETGEFEPVGSARTRHADIRFVCATNADIEGMVESGDFRRDLFYRLNTVILEVPPLRERLDDIEPLAQYFLARLKTKYRKLDLELSSATVAALKAYEWPGNIRELAHVIERAVLVTSSGLIEPNGLGIGGKVGVTVQEQTTNDTELMTLEAQEKALIERTLRHYDFNISQCAVSLGIGRSSLYRKLDAYGLASRSDEPKK